MRVLLVSQRFPPDDVGGVERYTQALAADLAKRGETVSVVTRRPVPARSDVQLLRERLPDNTAVYRLVGGGVRLDRFLQYYEALERLFTIALLESEAEIVHINHLIGLSPRFIQIAHRLGAAVVVSLHDFYFVCGRIHLQKSNGNLCDGPDEGRECARMCFTESSANGPVRWGLRTAYFRTILKDADAIVAYSEFVGNYFQRFVGDGRPIHVLANGVSVAPAFSDTPIEGYSSERSFTIAYCGMVAKHKGPHTILEALKIAALPSVKLIVIGSTPEREYAKNLRESGDAIPGLKLQMYGKYERSELSILLRDVDCVVVPSLVPEAGPIVPREALASGVPILVSRLGALPELIVEGENGFTFDPNDPVDLAKKLRSLAADKALLTRLRAGARRSPIVTVSEHTNRIRRIYEDAVRDLGRSHSHQDLPALKFLHESLVALGCEDGKARSSIGRRAGSGTN